MVQVQRYGSGQRCGSGSNIWFEVKVIVKGQKIWFEFKDGSRSKIWLEYLEYLEIFSAYS